MMDLSSTIAAAKLKMSGADMPSHKQLYFAKNLPVEKRSQFINRVKRGFTLGTLRYCAKHFDDLHCQEILNFQKDDIEPEVQNLFAYYGGDATLQTLCSVMGDKLYPAAQQFCAKHGNDTTRQMLIDTMGVKIDSHAQVYCARFGDHATLRRLIDVMGRDIEVATYGLIAKRSDDVTRQRFIKMMGNKQPPLTQKYFAEYGNNATLRTLIAQIDDLGPDAQRLCAERGNIDVIIDLLRACPQSSAGIMDVLSRREEPELVNFYEQYEKNGLSGVFEAVHRYEQTVPSAPAALDSTPSPADESTPG